MDKPTIYRKVNHETFKKLSAGTKTCWLQDLNSGYQVGDRIVFQELLGDLITGRCLEIQITGIEVDPQQQRVADRTTGP